MLGQGGMRESSRMARLIKGGGTVLVQEARPSLGVAVGSGSFMPFAAGRWWHILSKRDSSRP